MGFSGSTPPSCEKAGVNASPNSDYLGLFEERLVDFKKVRVLSYSEIQELSKMTGFSLLYI
jgi:hypothetical protein